VAPNVLPDLIALPSDQLENAVSDGLLYPLDGLLDMGNMYNAGVEFGRINNAQYGYPFLISDFYHLVYNPNVVTDIFARRWADFATLDRAQMILPANGLAGANLVLQLYRGANGSLTDGETAFEFQPPPLADAVNGIQRGVVDGFLLAESADITTESDAWNHFQSGNSTIIFINAETFLARRAQGNGSSFAPLPTSRTTTSPVVRGWVWAITTPNVERQAISAELITYLTNPQNLGTYSAALQILPARGDAFDAWQLNAYTTFLQTQLSAAVAYPNKLSINRLNALTTATVATLKQEITVEQAVEQINAIVIP
jgi:ABC-type glycerol-3-phosphate transport system substrate-binding protein